MKQLEKECCQNNLSLALFCMQKALLMSHSSFASTDLTRNCVEVYFWLITDCPGLSVEQLAAHCDRWSHQSVCLSCTSTLQKWLNGLRFRLGPKAHCVRWGSNLPSVGTKVLACFCFTLVVTCKVINLHYISHPISWWWKIAIFQSAVCNAKHKGVEWSGNTSYSNVNGVSQSQCNKIHQ